MTAARTCRLATDHDSSLTQGTDAEMPANHLEEFEVGKYRGIGKLHVKDIAKVNLIVGRNASGKTSLLEAIWLFCNRRNPKTLWHMDLSRSGRDYADPVAELGRAGEISMRGVQNGSSHSYSATFQTFYARPSAGRWNILDLEEPQVAGRLRVLLDGESKETGPAERLMTQKGLVMLPKLDRAKAMSKLLLHNSFFKWDADGLSEIIKQGHKKSLIERLRLILPLLRDVDVIVESDGNPYVLVTTDSGEHIRLEDLGGGMVRLFHCFVALYTSRNGIVCVGEIESGLHHTLLSKFWDSVRLLGKDLNVQIFVTTHSRECINAAIEAYKDRPNDVRIYTLYYNNDESRIKSVSYGGDELDAINSLNIDIR